ncbi:hypothetical protein ACJIZ3_021097 [Penstemon smallii]|uniref:GDSL esterase/lipase 5 n=1 Tax=Penstemon smallii TaxID=265156 RepID=A0ABD3SKP4_9LAMI
MAASKVVPFFLIFISFALPLIRAGKPPKPASPALFIFGDSLFDPGNNNYINTTTLDQANFRPYGETYFDYPTGRFSDGRLISDFIAEHAKLPLIPPYLEPRNKLLRQLMINYHGVNFASAGAGALTETFHGSVIDLKTQLKFYKREVARLSKKIGHANATNILSTAVNLFSIGTNDYISPFLLNSSVIQSQSHSQYVQMVIGNLTIVVKEIYRRGGRKFGFLNLGNLGCLPGLRIVKPETQGECLVEASVLAQLHNNELNKLLPKLEHNLHGFKYFLYDFNQSLARKITQPSLYGFNEGKKACCGIGLFNGIYSCGGKRIVKDFVLCENPSKFIFWDSYHFTENVYKQMADEMWSRGPNNLKKFFQ